MIINTIDFNISCLIFCAKISIANQNIHQQSFIGQQICRYNQIYVVAAHYTIIMVVSIIPQFPDIKVSLALFEQVKNAKEIRSKMSELSTSFAFIDPRLVCSGEQMYSAIYKTLIEVKYNKMRTRNLNSECVLCLSPTSNISDAFLKFGIKDDSSQLICLKFHTNTDDVDTEQLRKIMTSIVKGQEIEFNDDNLSRFYDEALIRKVCFNNKFEVKTSTASPETHCTNFTFVFLLFCFYLLDL